MNMNMRNWLNFTFFSMVLLSSVRAIAGPGENQQALQLAFL